MAACKHTGNKVLQRAACRALRNMNIGGGKHNVRAGTAGAVEDVVAAMPAHASDASVQARACGDLRKLTKGGAEAEKNRTRAGGAGAIEATVAAMLAHAAYEGLQEQACGGAAESHDQLRAERESRIQRGCHRGCRDGDVRTRRLRPGAGDGERCDAQPHRQQREVHRSCGDVGCRRGSRGSDAPTHG